jgi:hypothetical protein
MKKLILIPLLLLLGCSTVVPVTVKFPDAPKDLIAPCQDLKTLDAKTEKLSDVLEVVTDNYSLYYECKTKNDDWIEWYNSQKKIFDNIK